MGFLKYIIFAIVGIGLSVNSYGQVFGPDVCPYANFCDPQKFYNGINNKFYIKVNNLHTNQIYWDHDWVMLQTCDDGIAVTKVPSTIPVIVGKTGADLINLAEQRISSRTAIAQDGFFGNFSLTYHVGCGTNNTENICVLKKSGQFGQGLLLSGAQLESDGSYTITSQTGNNVTLNFGWQGDQGYCNETMDLINVYDPATWDNMSNWQTAVPQSGASYKFSGASMQVFGFGQHELMVRMSDKYGNNYTTIPIKVNIVPTCYSEVPQISFVETVETGTPNDAPKVNDGYINGDNTTNVGGYRLISGKTYTLNLGLTTADYCNYFETIVDDGSALANNGNNNCNFSCTPINRVPGTTNHLDITPNGTAGSFNIVVHDEVGFFTIHPQRKLCLGPYCKSFKPINIMVGGESLVSEIIPCLIILPQDLYTTFPDLPRSAGANQFILQHFTYTARSTVGIIVQDGVVLQDGAILKIDTDYQQPDAEKVDDNKNWVLQRAFDDAGQVIGESKSFYYNNGTLSQSQVKSLSQRMVLASETLYDKYRRPLINTLAAPVRLKETSTLPCVNGTIAGGDLYFIYKGDFSSGYSYPNFDSYTGNQYLASESYSQAHEAVVSKENNPDELPATEAAPGTLAWYYGSDNNSQSTSLMKEPYTARTGYPYSRTLMYPDGTGESKGSTLPGDVFKAGGGYVATQQTLSLMDDQGVPLPQEVTYLTAYTTLYSSVFPGKTLDPTTLALHAYKVSQKDNEGREAWTYLTVDGQSFMTKYLPTNDQTYQYYDVLGRLACSISPNGIHQLAAGESFAAIDKTSYTYNYRGWLLSTQKLDAGITKFLYRKDGNLRFSQNAEQALTGKYSYINYDKVGRAAESGVFDPSGTALTFSPTALTSLVLESTAADGGLTGGVKTEQILTHYDLAATDPLAPQGATFLVGKISYTEKPGVSKTWFSYDERGRIAWSAQWLQGFGATVAASIHKVEYRYDYSGNVQEVAYNRGQADQFYHVYQYDADNRLAEVFTSTIAPLYTLTGQPDKAVSLQRQAAYRYYLHGPLKRVELADGLQGVDYVYTAQGWLKSINNFRPDANRDPGADGDDVFGMSIDYYNGDYLLKPGGAIASPSIAGLTVPEKHSGNIRAVSWFSQKPTYDLTPSTPTAYQYTYDNKDQLTAAQWGTVGAPTNTFIASSPTMFAEKGITYDANGNMKTLQRYDKDGNFLQTGNLVNGIATHNFTAYHYQGNTNRLTSIDGYNMTYSYNAIGQLQSSSNGTKSKYPTYDSRGMVTSVTSDAAHSDPYVKSYYDDNGLRYKKESYHESTMVTTWYKYDASGNILGVYDDNNATQTLQRIETPIYAASRIGSYYHGTDDTDHYRYELTDNLGTVRATFSPDPVTPSVPKVESYADYYPYGLALRSAVAERYRFGYQGQYAEYDPETETNHFELRDYDPIVGRWLGPDPYQEFYSAYVGMGNNPVSMTDPSGGSTGGGDPEPTTVNIDDPNLVIHEDAFFVNGNRTKSYWDQVFWYGKNQVRFANDPQYTAFKEGGAIAADVVGMVMMGEGLLTLGVEGVMYLSARSAAVNVAANGGSKYLYHYTSKEAANNILKTGLTVTEKRPLIYTTNAGNLSPIQAQIELALPANRALPNTILRIDASNLSPALVRRVSGNLPQYGPGGGTEFLFNQTIPANLIQVVK